MYIKNIVTHPIIKYGLKNDMIMSYNNKFIEIYMRTQAQFINAKSIQPISAENLLRILPEGFLSKNSFLALRIFFVILL